MAVPKTVKDKEAGRRFARISALFDVGAIGSTHALVVGCGSGGGSVALQLAMSGVTRFSLVDKDILEPENVIRHVCGIRHLGMPKVDAVADVLLDRNPDIDVARHRVDAMEVGAFDALVRAADIVVLATDNEPSRWRVNELCVQNAIPFCVGRVFTRGIGGEVFAYRPGEGGCLACLESVLQRTQFRVGVKEVDLVSEEERESMYGLGIGEIKDSPGLNVDISFIASFHTRFVLDAIARRLPERPKYLMPIDENYLVWGNRPVPPFDKHFQVQRINLSAQAGCAVCGTTEADDAI